jgi:transposase
LPEDLPVERVVEPAPCACGKCGGARLRKLGEIVTRTLESEPRRWKIIEHVREKFTCRDCEAITEPPAPSHPIARGFAGPSLLAMILVSKFLLHQPLNRQAATYAREGVEIDTSTLADWVGACVVTLDPILAALKAHVLRGARIHACQSAPKIDPRSASNFDPFFTGPERQRAPRRSWPGLRNRGARGGVSVGFWVRCGFSAANCRCRSRRCRNGA